MSRLVRVPQPKTLEKYGLTRESWIAILRSQGGVCAICGKLPPSGIMHTDHEHVKGYKYLPYEQRSLYVRGILCFKCNGYLVRHWVTLENCRLTVTYLEAYRNRGARNA